MNTQTHISKEIATLTARIREVISQLSYSRITVGDATATLGQIADTLDEVTTDQHG